MTVGAWDPYRRDCPSRRLLDRIGDRWTVLIMGVLDGGPRRFTEIAAEVEGISQKMLTQTLRSLERDGLVSRTVTPTVPVTVTYELTGLGLSLQQLMCDVKAWAEAHMDEVLTNRKEYDKPVIARAGPR